MTTFVSTQVGAVLERLNCKANWNYQVEKIAISSASAWQTLSAVIALNVWWANVYHKWLIDVSWPITLNCSDYLYDSLGQFSRQHTDIFFIFPRKQDLTFCANCLQWKQDLTFHANCLHWRQYAWNVKICFLGKLRKIFQYAVCWEVYPEW